MLVVFIGGRQWQETGINSKGFARLHRSLYIYIKLARCTPAYMIICFSGYKAILFEGEKAPRGGVQSKRL